MDVPGVILPCSLNLLSFKTYISEINVAKISRLKTVSYGTEVIPDSPILLLRQKRVSDSREKRDRTYLDGMHSERTGRWPSQGCGDGDGPRAIDSILILCHTLPKLSRDNTWLETVVRSMTSDRSIYLFLLLLLLLPLPFPFLLNVIRNRVVVLPLLTNGLLLLSLLFLLFSFGIIRL
jgi:hypothetical protein